MAPYDIGSVDDLTELEVASFKNLLPDKNVGRNSDNWKRLRSNSGAVADLHAHILTVVNDIMPDKAGEATIERLGKIYGVPRKAASPASGEDAGKVKGANGSSWDTSDSLRSTSGLRFRPAASGTLGVSGAALVGVISLDVGPATRLKAGDVLTWEATPPGLENEVELQTDLSTGGEDKESLGAYRTRILDRIAQPAMGGNANDWEEWVVESASYIATGYIWPNRNGKGSVDVAGLRAGTGSARLLDASEQAILLAYVNTKRPVSARARVLDVLAEPLNVEVTVSPESDPQYAKDWTPSVQMVVSTWTAGTRTLVFTTDRPASMAVGHRIVVAGTSGEPLEIESLSSTNAVVLKDALGQTPVATANVYPGGPLTKPTRDAIIAFINSLGPRLGDFGQGNWESTYRTSRAFEIVQTVAGVLDSTQVTPTVNTEPTAESFPNDEVVSLLVPGNIIVRYA